MKKKIIFIIVIIAIIFLLPSCKTEYLYDDYDDIGSYIAHDYDYRAEIFNGYSVCFDYIPNDRKIKILDDTTYEVLWILDYADYGTPSSKAALKIKDYNNDTFYDILLPTTDNKLVYWYWDNVNKKFTPSVISSNQDIVTLKLEGNTEGFTSVAEENFKNTFYNSINLIWDRFSNQELPTEIILKFDNDYDYSVNIYRVKNNTIILNPIYFESNKYDYDIILQAIFEMAVSYDNEAPKWLFFGMKDYVRHMYGLFNYEASWFLPEIVTPDNKTQIYENSKLCAKFFIWVEDNYNNRIIDELNKCLLENKYSDFFWQNITDLSIDELITKFPKGN